MSLFLFASREVCRAGETVGTTPAWRAFSARSSASSSTSASTAHVRMRPRISSSTLRCSTTSGGVTLHLAIAPQPSSRRGRLWRNWVSMELGEGHTLSDESLNSDNLGLVTVQTEKLSGWLEPVGDCFLRSPLGSTLFEPARRSRLAPQQLWRQTTCKTRTDVDWRDSG